MDESEMLYCRDDLFWAEGVVNTMKAAKGVLAHGRDILIRHDVWQVVAVRSRDSYLETYRITSLLVAENNAVHTSVMI